MKMFILKHLEESDLLQFQSKVQFFKLHLNFGNVHSFDC